MGASGSTPGCWDGPMSGRRTARFWTRIGGMLTAGTLLAACLAEGPAMAAAGPVHAGSRPRLALGPAARDVGRLRVTASPRQRAVLQEPRLTETQWPAAGNAVAATSQAAAIAPPMTGTSVPLAALLVGPASDAGMGQAGRLPLFAGPAGGHVPRVRFRLLGHAAATAAGVRGVVFTVAASAGRGGRVRVAVDYAGFGQAYGGGYGASLGLAVLPACALTTPRVPACQKPRRLPSANDAQAQTVSAVADVPAASAGVIVVAAAASPQDGGGNTGNYQQPAGLNPSGTWSEGGSSGAFTYAYPMTVPPAPGGLQPGLELGYDSGVIDAQTAATQPQASWVGDGWTLPQSYISQSFTACADDPEGSAAPESTQDACYDGPILDLTIDGASMPLVCPSPFSYTATSTCYAEEDPAEVVTHYVGSGNGQGTHFTDYWTVTTTAGITYYFGLNHLPGWASGDTATNSVDWEPVFSANSGDPCYHLTADTFAGSVCDMAYQWNLDYVTDAYGNAMAYFYTQATNGYDEYGSSSAQEYIRDSYLKDILYGFTSGNAYSTATATAPADEVAFTTGERCFASSSDCGTAPSSSNASYWEDVPTNLICTVGDACSSASGYGPTFFSTVALTKVTTYQRTGSSTTPATAVDAWTLTPGFQGLPSGDSSDVPTLTLSSITREGEDATSGATAGSSVTLPAITFEYTMLQNQLDPGTAPWMSRPRLTSITTETGSVITANYEQPAACAVSSDPVSPSANDLSCFPIYWGTFTSSTSPDWFIKYAVQSVQQSDPSGGSPGLYTAYYYVSPAWHYDDNEVVEAKDRTYGQWRGYQTVYTFTGSGSDPQTESSTKYYQGMSDDNDSTDVTIPDSQGNDHEDADQLAGDVLEQTTYDYATTPGTTPPQSSVDHSAIYSYWISGNVASRTRTGLPALTANAIGLAETWTRQAITDTATTTWRETATDTTYYSATSGSALPLLGEPEYAYSLGDLSQLSDPTEETCTTTSYITGSDNLVLPSSTEEVSLPCGGSNTGTSSMPTSAEANALSAPSGVASSDVVSASRTFYDDQSLATTWPQPASSSITWPQAAPGNPEVSVVQDASSYNTSTSAFTYQTTSASEYNGYGQITASYDGNGGEHPVSGTATYTPTSTAYTLTDGSDTAETVTNPLGQATATTYDPARGSPVTVTDPNGVVTTYQYDELGRLTSEWEDSRATSSDANYVYAYAIGTATTPTVVTTKQLNNESGYITSTTLYDALLRVRQTQVPTPQGGILVTDDFYDSRGWLGTVNHDWWDSTASPGSTILTIAGSQVPSQTVTSYDALGRAVEVTDYDDSTVKSVAYTQYTGDKVITVPASGATPTATVTDALGRAVEQDSYTTAPTVATSTNAGGFATVSVTGGTTEATDYSYDSQGQVGTVTAGGETWTEAYNMLGQKTSQTSPNSGTTGMSYDADGNLVQTSNADGDTITYTYDALSRKTGEYDGTSDTAPPIATWVYDNSNDAVSGMTDPIGQLTTETSYDQNGDAFTIQQAGFNVFGDSLGETVTVPSDQGDLAGTYALTSTYSTVTGLPLKTAYPASPDGGSLPAETVTTGYATGFDLPNTLSSGLAGYAAGVTYTAWTQVGQEELGTTSVNAYITNTYDPNTGNLTNSQVANTSVSSTPYDSTSYTYDPSGNITSETDTRYTAATGSETEQQCFDYDTLDQLSQAWTTAAGTACSSSPSTGSGGTVGDGISGSAYWTSWAYNPLGDQATQTSYSLSGSANTVTSFTYNDGKGTSSGQPNTLTSTATAGGSTASASYSYDADGNTTAIDQSSGNQTLTWYPDGKVSTDTTSAGTTSYVYDADGNLLAADNPGSETLYVFGEQITATTSDGTTTVTGIRYIPLPGGGDVVRTGAGTSYYYETGDQHGTMLLALGNTLQNPVWRQFTPFGAPRGTATGTWPDTNGFLGDPVNANDALSTVGARQYDSATGRFLSPDPVLEAGDPAQMGGYAYAADNPVTDSDPSGECPSEACAGMEDSPPAPKTGQPNPGIPCGTPGGYACWTPPGSPGCPPTIAGCPGYSHAPSVHLTVAAGFGTSGEMGPGIPGQPTTFTGWNDPYTFVEASDGENLMNGLNSAITAFTRNRELPSRFNPYECTVGIGAGLGTVCGGIQSYYINDFLRNFACNHYGLVCSGPAATGSAFQDMLKANSAWMMGFGRDGSAGLSTGSAIGDDGGISMFSASEERDGSIGDWENGSGNMQILLAASDGGPLPGGIAQFLEANPDVYYVPYFGGGFSGWAANG
jgi:RHS repeat-associated protein